MTSTRAPATGVLAGGGEMGALMRSLDWRATSIGPVVAWPQSLRTAVSIVLSSRFPMLIWWGPELVMLYNDAYRPMLGMTKHPRSMGQRGRDCWPEIWDVIGPMLDGVLTRGEATWSDDQLLLLDRNGYVEECYFTFSYSPIRDESGGVGGVFCAVTETTGRVVGERRLRALRELAARTAEARTVDDACTLAASALGGNPADVPFALLYLLDAGGDDALLATTVGLDAGTRASPYHLALAQSDEAMSWPFAEVARTGLPVVVEDLAALFGSLAIQPDAATPRSALVLPVAQAGQEQVAGFLVAGISPQRALDDEYRGFFGLVAGQIATAITDARAYEAERGRAEALAELDRAKTAFFSNVSHEFRTPLTLALAPLEEALADTREPLPARQRERTEIAHRNSLRLLRLVNTLLDFSRIEAGRAEASYEPTDLAVLTSDLAGVFRSAIERAGLRLVVDCPPLPAPVYVDHEMWEKIVLNLLSNAFKFTLDGAIAVRLRAAGESVVLEVHDTGRGIPPEELPRIFDRFHRVRDARGRTFEGTGIGLALVQELVSLHGGAIVVDSVVDSGTTFTVTLPLGMAHLPAERIGAARTRASTALGAAPYVEEALRWLPDADSAESVVLELPAALVGAGAPAEAAMAARVLLADDNADMRAYLRRLFGARYAVEAVADGAAALAAAQARPPDLVLADVMMPRLDGFALLRALRADPRTREVPIILLSARAGEEAHMEGLDAGADDYLVKPFSARELLARVEAHLRLARVRAQAMETERTLRAEAEAGYRRLGELFQVAPAMIAVLRGPEHVFEVANDLYQQGVGRGSADLLGRTVREVFPELAGQGFYELLDEVYRAGRPHMSTDTHVRLDRDGDGLLEDVYFTFTYQPMRDAAGAVEGILVLAVDVTAQVQARRRTEELARQVQAERDRLQQVVNLLPAAVVVTDTALIIQVSNRAVRTLLGAADATPRPPVEAGEAVPSDDAAALVAYGARHLDGTPYRADEIPLARAALQGEEVRGEQMLLRHVTGRDVPILVNAAPLRDDAGAILGGVAVFQDITELHDLERAREEFLSSAAHDLKTPLTSIRGLTQLAQRRLVRLAIPNMEQVMTSLTQVEDGTQRMLSLINELVDVTRVQMGAVLELDRRPTDLVALVRAVVAAQEGVSTHRIGMESSISTLMAAIDAARVERVVGNLLSNAIKYSPTGSAITVHVTRDDDGAGSWAVIAVHDEGIGIPAADLPYIFERFRRAGNVGRHIQGTGIGLASVRQIVEQHGGSITVESAEGVGSTFTVRLPLVANS